jgi:hypothetical protein
VLLSCGEPIDVQVDQTSWLDQPPPPGFCEPGQDPFVDENLVADCTAMTKDFGDWFIGVTEMGEELLGWKF